MTVLEQVYASGGDVIIPTLELICAAWDSPILLCAGFEDQTVTDENGRTLTFTASGIDVALPAKNNTGNQTITFAIDNIDGVAQQKIDAALEAEERVALVYREFLDSDRSAPEQQPYRMTVMGGTLSGSAVQIQAGYYDILNAKWPRDLYTAEFSPGLRYL